jgi:hypothetical protein
MRAALWFRATAIALLLMAAGHTYGFLGFRPPTAEGLAVWTSMNQVRFAVGHSTYSYGGFYVGFGLFISAFYLFTAWLAWVVGRWRNGRQRRRGVWRLECWCCSASGWDWR